MKIVEMILIAGLMFGIPVISLYGVYALERFMRRRVYERKVA